MWRIFNVFFDLPTWNIIYQSINTLLRHCHEQRCYICKRNSGQFLYCCSAYVIGKNERWRFLKVASRLLVSQRSCRRIMSYLSWDMLFADPTTEEHWHSMGAISTLLLQRVRRTRRWSVIPTSALVHKLRLFFYDGKKIPRTVESRPCQCYWEVHLENDFKFHYCKLVWCTMYSYQRHWFQRGFMKDGKMPKVIFIYKRTVSVQLDWPGYATMSLISIQVTWVKSNGQLRF